MVSPWSAEQEAFLHNCTPAQLMDEGCILKKLSELASDPGTLQLEKSLALAPKKEPAVTIIRRLLIKASTDVIKMTKTLTAMETRH